MRITERYVGLDGLRGVAAILVVMVHARLFALHACLATDLVFHRCRLHNRANLRKRPSGR